MPSVSLSLNSVAPGRRVYASAALRSSRGYQVPHTDNDRNPVYLSRPDTPTSPSPRPLSTPSSPFYLCIDPFSIPPTYHNLSDGSGDLRRAFADRMENLVRKKPPFVFSPSTSRTFKRNGISIPSQNLFAFPKSPAGESVHSVLSTSSSSSDVSWTPIKDPFARERGNTHTSDIDSADFSYTASGMTLYTASTVEYAGSDKESHSSDLVPVRSPCIRLNVSPLRSPSPSSFSFSSPVASVFSGSPSSLLSSAQVAPVSSSSPSPVTAVPFWRALSSRSTRPSIFSSSLARAHLSSGSLSLLSRPPPVPLRHPRGRFYNPRFDPAHPLFEPSLTSRPSVASRSLPRALETNDRPLPIPEPDQVLDQELDHELDQELYQESEQELKQELEPEDTNLPLPPQDTNLSYPIPGDWPEESPDTLEPTSGPAGWLKALTSPAV
jgi:hypothetical protein